MRSGIILLLCICAGLSSVYAISYHDTKWGIVAEPVLTNLDIPWDAEFADDTLFFTTRHGTLYVLENQTTNVILQLDVGGGEGGMLGLALHPDFAENSLLYVYYTGTDNRVVRYVYGNGTLVHDSVIIQGISAASNHNGGRVAFGPDDMLYVTTGDAGNAALSQDVASLSGKILRMTPEGGVPDDNPIPGSLVYAYGLRNPQGMAWDFNGTMFVTDHGPSGFYGRAHDEINAIVPQGNYGWPHAIGSDIMPDMIPPLIHSGQDTWAPSGMAYVSNSTIPSWDDKILYGALRGQHIGIVSLNGSSYDRAFEGDLGRIRHVFQHDNGTIYAITSNTDGRGSPSSHDDMILRLSIGQAPACNMPSWLSLLC